jgi:hypothetical protein
MLPLLLWTALTAVPLDADVDPPSPLNEARGITAVVNEATGETVDTEVANTWVSIELFVIASLQLILVLVAYRLDRAKHPALISESVIAMFFGVMVRSVLLIVPAFLSTMLTRVLVNSLARSCDSSRPWYGCIRCRTLGSAVLLYFTYG